MKISYERPACRRRIYSQDQSSGTAKWERRKIEREKPATEKPKILGTPDYLQAASKSNPKAKEVFESKSHFFRKEYIIWITDAKTDETRQKRINEALQWIAEGKGGFWKRQK